MENTKTRMTVLDCLKKTYKCIKDVGTTMAINEDDNIIDFEDLESNPNAHISSEDKEIIKRIKDAERELRNKVARSKKSLQKQLETHEIPTSAKKQYKIVEKENVK